MPGVAGRRFSTAPHDSVAKRDRETRLAIIARGFALLTPATRDATIVLDPIRQGSQELTDAIRAAPLRDGQLGAEAMTATVLQPHGLGRAAAARAASYTPVGIVTFHQQPEGEPRRGIGYRAEAVDAKTGRCGSFRQEQGTRLAACPLRLHPPRGVHGSGADVPRRQPSAVYPKQLPYRPQDSYTATIVAIDPQGSSMMVERQDDGREMLNFYHLAECHVRAGCVCTTHSA